MDSNRKRHSGDRYSSYGYGHGSYTPYGYGSRYGYGYGGYGYGYGQPGGGEATLQKTVHDYLLILRERVWYIVVAFLLVVGADAIYTLTRVPRFNAEATVEVFHRTPTVLQDNQPNDSQISSAEDLNTQVDILESHAIIDNVAAHLTGATLDKFLAPYQNSSGHVPHVADILLNNRRIVPERLSYIIEIQYEHPDKGIAALVANLFASEYIAYNEKLRVNQSMQAVDELRLRADEQRTKVDSIAAAIQAYREKNNLVSLDQRKDIVTEALKDLDKDVTDSSAALQIAETNWKEVEDCRRSGRSCLDLSFIASIPTVSKLQEDVASQQIVVAQLSQRYRAKHPQMIAAMATLQAAQKELLQAIDTATAQVQAQYQTALQNYRKAQAALATQEADSLRLDRYGLEYSNLEREYSENERILDQILASQLQEQQSSSGTLENETARIVDEASPPARPSSPNFKLNMGLGAAVGLGFGLGLAFFAAYNDDRIKSAFDIETVIGLPLIGIIPRFRNSQPKSQGKKTEGAAEVPQVREALSSIMSGLQLKDESKKAQCILVTSTVAGEGKTFISTGLAETYAIHGERVVVVDCDLRRPAVNRAFHLENLRGVIDVCASSMALDEVIAKEVRPNLDVIPTGGRSNNPTQLLNSKAFAQMISDLRKRYDRIFVDTPPAGVVSDAFIILPMMDGALYSILFNKVRRKAAQFCTQRLLEVNVPTFGAILNGLAGGVGGYYYAQYYGRSYKDYYLHDAKHANGAGPKIVEPGGQRDKPRR